MPVKFAAAGSPDKQPREEAEMEQHRRKGRHQPEDRQIESVRTQFDGRETLFGSHEGGPAEL